MNSHEIQNNYIDLYSMNRRVAEERWVDTMNDSQCYHFFITIIATDKFNLNFRRQIQFEYYQPQSSKQLGVLRLQSLVLTNQIDLLQNYTK